jgi:hypothetical protein
VISGGSDNTPALLPPMINPRLEGANVQANAPVDRLASILRRLVEAQRQKLDRRILNAEPRSFGYSLTRITTHASISVGQRQSTGSCSAGR